MVNCQKKWIGSLLGLQNWFVTVCGQDSAGPLKIEDVYHEDEGFVLTFKKGKSYQYGESHIGVLSNLPRLKYNPAKIFSLYLDQVALIHEKSNTPSDFLFPSLRKSRSVLHSLDKPVS